MKKTIFLTFALLLSLCASAQMKIVEGSFKDWASANKSVGGENGMGVTNMTSEVIEWPADADGNEGTLALLMVNFENMAPEDIKKVGASLSKSLIVAKTDTKIINNRYVQWYFIPEGTGIDVTLSHEKFGEDRLYGKEFKAKHIYEMTVRNNGIVSVAITSEPAGANVIFDGVQTGKTTPATLEDVKMGRHTLSLEPSDKQIAHPLRDHALDVSSTETSFNFNLYKKKNLFIVAKPATADVVVTLNNEVVAEGTGNVELKDAMMGHTYVLKGRSGMDELTDNLYITEATPKEYVFNIVGSRSISFFAKQNNSLVEGATVTVNGTTIGYTPLTKVLENGDYTVEMSYNGYNKSKHLKVNPKAKEMVIKLPNHKSTSWSPFDVDYHKRAWGIAANYIHRYYNFKVNGKSTKYNWLGEEGGSNGFQVGIAYQPYFGYGQGLNTGLYFQGTYGSSSDIANEKVSYQESALFMPLQYQFRLPLHRNVSVAVNAGLGFTFGLSNKWKFEGYNDSYDVGYGHNEEYDTYHPEAFDYSLLFGVAFQFKALQIEGKYSMGLRDHKDMYTAVEGDKMSYKSAAFILGLSLMF